MKIKFLGQAGIKITNENIIYIDPFKIKESDTADLIFITHEHYDHCSIGDLKEIAGNETVIIAASECKGKIDSLKCKKIFVKPGEKKEVKGVIFETVPAYNIEKPFHTKEANKVGYIIEIGGRRIYHAGDTDLIPEMKKLKADVALLPIGGTYTMDVNEAAEAANQINPKIMIPIHYGNLADAALKANPEELKEKVSCEVKILNPGEEAEV